MAREWGLDLKGGGEVGWWWWWMRWWWWLWWWWLVVVVGFWIQSTFHLPLELELSGTVLHFITLEWKSAMRCWMGEREDDRKGIDRQGRRIVNFNCISAGHPPNPKLHCFSRFGLVKRESTIQLHFSSSIGVCGWCNGRDGIIWGFYAGFGGKSSSKWISLIEIDINGVRLFGWEDILGESPVRSCWW